MGWFVTRNGLLVRFGLRGGRFRAKVTKTRYSGAMPTSDFDFLFGRWTIRNRVLRDPLRRADEWCEFTASFECRSLGRLGNIGHFRSSYPAESLEGASLRLYMPATDEWTLRWADTPRPGAIQPPLVGRFQGACGAFYGNAFYEVRPIRVRVVWTRGPHPHFEQAFSTDRGANWITNWHMSLTAAADDRKGLYAVSAS
jgi:hypothetical protein